MASDSILSISADIETIGEILKKIIPTLEEVCLSLLFASSDVKLNINFSTDVPFCGAFLHN